MIGCLISMEKLSSGIQSNLTVKAFEIMCTVVRDH
jgi:hypothetical protein